MLRGRVATLKNAIVLHLEPVRGDASDVGFDLSPRRNVLPWSLFLQWNVIQSAGRLGEGVQWTLRCVLTPFPDPVGIAPIPRVPSRAHCLFESQNVCYIVVARPIDPGRQGSLDCEDTRLLRIRIVKI
jgi:hypothetical protein